MGDKRDRKSKEKNGKGPLPDPCRSEKKVGSLRFELKYETKAVKVLLKLPEKIREQIFKRLDMAQYSPFHFFQRLEGRTDYKMRVGDHRIIADIDIKTRTVQIRLIGHRKKIYKNI